MPINVSSLNGLFKEFYSKSISNLVYSNIRLLRPDWEIEGYPSEEIYNLHKMSMNSLKDPMGIK